MEKNIKEKRLKNNTKGITLIALVVTIIVLLILAAVSLNAVLNDKGIFSRAESAGAKYNEAKAREVLETVLLADGQYEKNINPDYNQDDFLDDLIKNEIPGSRIQGDVAIVGEWAFELDRSVPKIGRGLGNVKDLIFPNVTVAEITQADPADNYRTAKIEITATIDEKAENGINRIEIWQNGTKLETITCNNEKTVTKQYTANRNGIYTIKAYSEITEGEISGSARTKVEGIVPAVEFMPNGNTNWQKSHTTTVKVTETAETVTEMKYLWKLSTEGQPQESDFNSAESCTNSSQITGQGETMTGKYYLWVLVKLGTGTNQKTYISGSEEFYFDNEGPTITTGEAVNITDKKFQIKMAATDEHSDVAGYKVYLSGKMVQNKNWDGSEITCDDIEWTDTDKECYVVAVDSLGNIGNQCYIYLPQWGYWWRVYNKLWEHTVTPTVPETVSTSTKSPGDVAAAYGGTGYHSIVVALDWVRGHWKKCR